MNTPSIEIDRCKYLYLASISEPAEGGLKLVIQEARAGGKPSAAVLSNELLPELKEILSKSSAIEHGPGCKVFEIYWSRYIAYSVENESYALSQSPEDKSQGRLFKLYETSAYLEYLEKVSFASADYPRPYKHWGVICLDHIVNVASTEEPVINARDA
jgi:hypothetical protein